VNFLEAHFPFHQLPKEFVTAYQNRPISELREAGQIAFGAQFGRPLTQAEIEQIRAPLVDLYDGGVKYTDFLVGEVIDEWRKAGKLDNTVVVVLGDHGEVMGEHDAFGHVVPMVEEDLRVPLIFRYPPSMPKGKRVKKPVSTVGTFATLADLADLDPETVPRLHVGSLADFDAARLGEPVMAERYEEHLLSARFAEGQTLGVGPLMDPRGRYRSFRWNDWKYIERCDHGEEKTYLYNLAADPGELNDLMPQRPSVVDDIEPELLQVKELFQLPGVCEEVSGEVRKLEDMSEEEIAMLCELGYMEGDMCP
jgi:arylsulfatase A-like enzyme